MILYPKKQAKTPSNSLVLGVFDGAESLTVYG